MIIHQFNQNRPKLFEANRTQVNINIVEATKVTMDGEVSGFEYDTVVIEKAHMYGDDALVQIAGREYAMEYLASTDWITSKYNDVVTVLGTMSKADFVAKYKEIYDNRTAARAVVGGE